MASRVNFSKFLRKHLSLDLFNMLVELRENDLDPVILESECKYSSSGEKSYYYRVRAYPVSIHEDQLDIFDRVKDLLKDYGDVGFTVVSDYLSVALELEGDMVDNFIKHLSRITCKLPLFKDFITIVSISPIELGIRYGLNLKIAYCWHKDEVMVDTDEVANALADSIEDISEEYYKKGVAGDCEGLRSAAVFIKISDTDRFTVNGKDIILDIDKLKNNLYKIILKSKKNIVTRLGLSPEKLDKEYLSIKSLDPLRETNLDEDEMINLIYSVGESVLGKLDCTCQKIKRYYIILKLKEHIVIVDMIPLEDNIFIKIDCKNTRCEEDFLLELLKHYYRKRRDEAEKYILRLSYADLLHQIEEERSLISILSKLNKLNQNRTTEKQP